VALLAVQHLTGICDNQWLLRLVMDLDLGLVRAFVAVAESENFGRAALGLGLSQQALSKRVARLESGLSVRLFDRGAHGASLTSEGERFLEPARQALLAGGAAVSAVSASEARSLRVDVWGHLFGPLRTVRAALDFDAVSVGVARDFPAVVAALRRGELDAGFGRVHPLDDPWQETLAHRLVRLEPVDVVLGSRHPLAGSSSLRPSDLRDSVMWFPAAASRLDFLRGFCDEFGIPTREGGPNLGVDAVVDVLSGDPEVVTLMPADVPLPSRLDVRAIALVDPTPLYAWSLVWRHGDWDRRILRLLDAFAAVGQRSRWLEYDPARDWLPEAAPAGYGAGPVTDDIQSASPP
jgi:DNA-binding transcriptional LysR family regulator